LKLTEEKPLTLKLESKDFGRLNCSRHQEGDFVHPQECFLTLQPAPNQRGGTSGNWRAWCLRNQYSVPFSAWVDWHYLEPGTTHEQHTIHHGETRRFLAANQLDELARQLTDLARAFLQLAERMGNPVPHGYQLQDDRARTHGVSDKRTEWRIVARPLEER
jgi:hypothetical protein